MKVFKRNAVIITVLLFVCVAVYLNWSYNRENGGGEDVMEPGVSDAATDTENNDSAGSSGLYYEAEGEDNTAVADEVSEYFATARLSRQQSRDQATQTLTVITETDSASQESVDEAMSKMIKIAEWTVKESELESMILAKGFGECVVIISETGVTVAVPAPDGLTSVQVAQITEIVTTETAFSPGELTVFEIK